MVHVCESLGVIILGQDSHFQIYDALYLLFNLENSVDCFDTILGYSVVGTCYMVLKQVAIFCNPVPFLSSNKVLGRFFLSLICQKGYLDTENGKESQFLACFSVQNTRQCTGCRNQ